MNDLFFEPSRQRHYRGISLIELIVVSIVCAILGLISISNLRHLREQSRTDTCRNKIVVFGLAAYDFHDTRLKFPPGTIGCEDLVDYEKWNDSKWKDFFHTSALGQMLPFVGMQLDHKKADPMIFRTAGDLSMVFDRQGKRMFQWVGETKGYPEMLISGNPSMYLCPSDSLLASEKIEFTMGTHPVKPAESNKAKDQMWTITFSQLNKEFPNTSSWKSDKPFSHTNYIACTGAHSGGRNFDSELRPYAGAMATYRGVSMRVIVQQDGASNTIMFGETIGEIDNGKRTQLQSYFAGGLARGRGLVPWGKSPTDALPLFGNANRASVYGFGAMHESKLNFVFCDTAVRSISREIDAVVFDQLCGLYDGGSPNLNDVAPEFKFRTNENENTKCDHANDVIKRIAELQEKASQLEQKLNNGN